MSTGRTMVGLKKIAHGKVKVPEDTITKILVALAIKRTDVKISVRFCVIQLLIVLCVQILLMVKSGKEDLLL